MPILQIYSMMPLDQGLPRNSVIDKRIESKYIEIGFSKTGFSVLT